MQLNEEQVLVGQIIKDASILWKGKYCLKPEDYAEHRNREIIHMIAVLTRQEIEVDTMVLASKLPNIEPAYFA